MSLTLSFTAPLTASAVSAVTAMPLAVEEEQVTPGLLGLAVVASLGVALFFLIKSMNKQIGRIQVPKGADLEEAEWERREAELSDPPKP